VHLGVMVLGVMVQALLLLYLGTNCVLVQAHPLPPNVGAPRGDGLPHLNLPAFDVLALTSILQTVDARSGPQSQQQHHSGPNSQALDLQAILQGAGVKPLLPNSQGENSGQPVDPRARGGGAAVGGMMEAPQLAGEEGTDVGSSMMALMRGFL